jgi:DNA-binding beta-propeller fold protein YncE
MKIVVLGRYALGVCASVALLAACSSGGSQLAPSAGTTARLGTNGSWMAPEAKSEDLLYVSTSGGVAVYSYPAAVLVGTLSLLSPAGLCADNAGNVWITGNQQLVEYAHGGSQPIATLDDSGYSPKGCAVDPTTGDLAVTNFVGAKRHQRGNILIYKNAQGTPRAYGPSLIRRSYYCTYDDKGDLFVDGTRHISAFKLVELKKSRQAFEPITLSRAFKYTAGIQWDGKYLAVADPNKGTIYQFTMSGSTGAETGSTQLLTGDTAWPFWIQGQTVIAAVPAGTTLGVGLWTYPAGGSPTKTVVSNGYFGATVSLAEPEAPRPNFRAGP